MRRTILGSLGLVLVATWSCPVSAQKPVSAQEGGAEEGAVPEGGGTAAVAGDAFPFAWPVPATAAVIKDGEKKGNKVRMRFRLDVTAGDAGELRVRMQDFEFLEVNGQDATTPAMREALAPALAMTQAVPDMVVSVAGEYLRIDGIDEMIERVTKAAGERRGRPAAEQERVLKMLRTPRLQETLQQACGVDWNIWAGSWVGFDATPDHETSGVIETSFFGVPIENAVTRRHHGAAPDHPGHVRLTTQVRIEGPEATAAFGAGMKNLTDAAGAPLAPDRLESVRVDAAFETVTDPATVLPLRASMTRTIRIALTDGETQEEVERRDYTFEWSKAAADDR